MGKLLLLFMISCCCAFAQPAAQIKIDISSKPVKIDDKLFGGFIEFLNGFVNGPGGLWAQEFFNRGFDLPDEHGLSRYWKKWNNSSIADWRLEEGAYNPRGVYAQVVDKKDSAGETGPYQIVYLTDSTSHDFYIYLKGDSTIKAELVISDTSFSKEMFRYKFSEISEKWKKYSCRIPELQGMHKAAVLIKFNGKGIVYMDEASFMPSNNVHGIRREYYELLKEWKIPILRYPGGWFADTRASHWQYGIGDVDKRTSPNVAIDIPQRLDWGTDEYIVLCKELGIEPHLVVNFRDGSPEEAAAWVEYCNGSPDSEFGKLRAENGYPEPYNVKIWEIGNELWTDPAAMAQRSLVFDSLMKKKDPAIKTIICGNTWDGEDFFKSVMLTAKEKTQYYSWHWVNFKIPRAGDEYFNYLYNLASAEAITRYIEDVDRWLRKYNFRDEVKQANTEWWFDYGHPHDWLLDTNQRTTSLEAALASAMIHNNYVRNAGKIELAERTLGIGIFKWGENSHGKRIIFGGSMYQAMKMLHRRRGQFLIDMEVTGGKDKLEAPWIYNFGMNWIDAVASSSGDTLFLNIINKHPYESYTISLNLNDSIEGKSSLRYEIYNDNYLANNNPDNPELISEKEYPWTTDNQLTVKPHSINVFVFPGIQFTHSPYVPNDNIIYPNPAEYDADLYFERKEEEVKVTLYDMLGKPVMEITERNTDKVRLNLRGISTGVYFAVVELKGRKLYHKLEKL